MEHLKQSVKGLWIKKIYSYDKGNWKSYEYAIEETVNKCLKILFSLRNEKEIVKKTKKVD